MVGLLTVTLFYTYLFSGESYKAKQTNKQKGLFSLSFLSCFTSYVQVLPYLFPRDFA